jgi:hypothetical protein
VSDPAVFKNAGGVKTLAALLEPLNQKTFLKKADINKLLKSGWLDRYDPPFGKKGSRLYHRRTVEIMCRFAGSLPQGIGTAGRAINFCKVSGGNARFEAD